MGSVLASAVRDAFRHERIPARVRWWFAAQGMCEWYGALQRGLSREVGTESAAEALLATLSARVFVRRYELMRASVPTLPARSHEPRAVGWLMGGLYRVATHPDAHWIFAGVGGAPRGFAEHLRAEQLMAPLDSVARWNEVTTHLGELLIALTEGLPAAGFARARPVLADICFDAGVHVGRKIKRAFDLDESPEAALEVLRMSEFVFRVNPAHWGGTDAARGTGWLEGTACPWYDAPGWNGAHCGIFGQFQSGICSVFGLRYHLTSTIPKHGGHTCRIDVRPLDPLRDERAIRTVARAARGAS